MEHKVPRGSFTILLPVKNEVWCWCFRNDICDLPQDCGMCRKMFVGLGDKCDRCLTGGYWWFLFPPAKRNNLIVQ